MLCQRWNIIAVNPSHCFFGGFLTMVIETYLVSSRELNCNDREISP